MADKDDFQKKLVETFKIESQEHIDAISKELITLEKPDISNEDKNACIENGFREMHSLKGAARAVMLADIEEVCQSAENVFSDLKSGNLSLTKEIVHSLHEIIEKIQALLGQDPEDVQTLETVNEILDFIRSIVDGAEIKPPEEVAPEEKEVPPSPPENQPAPEPIPEQEKNEAPPKQEETPQKAEITPPIQEQQPPSQAAETVRISTEKLDAILVELEELISINSLLEGYLGQIKSLKAAIENQKGVQLKMRTHLIKHVDLKSSSCQKLNETLELLNKNTSEIDSHLHSFYVQGEEDALRTGKLISFLLESLKDTLMQPFSLLLQPFHMMVRNLAKSLGKEVNFSVEGELNEVDKRILEELKDPLIHIIRNALDHGIEDGEQRKAAGKPPDANLTVQVIPSEDRRIEVIVQDDGRGIDLEKVRAKAVEKQLVEQNKIDLLSEEEVIALLFKSDISTASKVTEISGRGLGLEIVHEKVLGLGGTIHVDTEQGKGTTFSLIIPSKRATFRGIHIRAHDRDFIIPTINVKRLMRLNTDQIKKIENRNAIFIDETPIPLMKLGDTLGLPQGQIVDREMLNVVVTNANQQTVAFEIDEVVKERPILIKALNKQLEGLQHVSAMTVLDTNHVVPILSPHSLIQNTLQKSKVKVTGGNVMENEATDRNKRALVVDDSPTSLLLLKNIVTKAGYEVLTANDGEEAYMLMQREEVDILVSDVNMPKMDGFQLCAKLRAEPKYAKFPIIFVTALNSDEDRQRGNEVGVDAYIAKADFDAESFLAKLNELT